MEHAERIAERLRKVAKDLERIAQDIAQPPGELSLPPDKQARVDSGLCLLCDRKPTRRGLCAKHYQVVIRRVKDDPAEESKAVGEGLIGPPAHAKPKLSAIEDIYQALAKDEITKDRAGKRGK